MQHLPVGRRGILLELSDSEFSDPVAVATAVRHLARGRGIELSEVVPGASTVLVLADDEMGIVGLVSGLADLPAVQLSAERSWDVLELAARYDGPDLISVADASGLSVEEVVRRHSSVTYRAAFTGFAPGFAYLVGLDPALRLPRRDTPRSAVPKGSLAVADIYTAVYPRRSPGGWHLLGTVDVSVFDVDREPAALLGPGQMVRFVVAPT